MVDTLNYLEEMGYDLYGYGFVTKKDALETTTEKGNEEKSLKYDVKDDAYKYVRTYLVSDNYATITKNSNKNLKTMFSSWATFWSSDPLAWGSRIDFYI